MNISKVISKTLNQTLDTVNDTLSDKNFVSSIEFASSLLIDTYNMNGKVLLAGNGGSAADSQHICAEFIGRLNFDRKSLPAIALTTNSSNLTCLANDYGFDEVFSRQIESLGAENDTLIVYSTSGKSPNIVSLVKRARPIVKSIISLTGSHTDTLSKYSDVVISVKSSQTTKIQEVHAIAGHVLCECVEQSIFKG